MLGIKPRAAECGSKYADHCAMLPPFNVRCLDNNNLVARSQPRNLQKLVLANVNSIFVFLSQNFCSA